MHRFLVSQMLIYFYYFHTPQIAGTTAAYLLFTDTIFFLDFV
jgi:hypothetical protein